MTMDLNKKACGRYVATIVAITLLLVLTPLGARAGQLVTPTCNALASMGGNLYLVDSSGTILTQFTSDGVAKVFATLSPKGDRVAFANGRDASSFEVVNKYGQQGFFPVNPDNQSDSSGDNAMVGSLLGLSWNSDRTLRVTTSYGKDYAKFGFRHIPDDLSSPALADAKSAVEQNCVRKKKGGLVACIDQDGGVSLGGSLDTKDIYFVPRFKGVTPLASFKLHVGESTTPENAPPYKVTVEGINKNVIDLALDSPNPEYPAPEAYIKSGSYLGMTDYQNDEQYGYFATIINSKSGLVRIDVIKSNTPEKPVGMGLAWQPHGEGLLFVQRTNTQTFLDLIQPGRGHVNDHPAKGQGSQWHLAAQVPISLPGKVQSMRFLLPGLLLLNTGDFRGPQYSEVPIHIANGKENGKPPLTVGAVKPLPATIAATKNGKTTQASVLDWSCKAYNGDDGDD